MLERKEADINTGRTGMELSEERVLKVEER